MALTDLYSNVHLFFRWLHVLAGIVWIGHLYFFNFVNVAFQGKLDDATKKAVNPQLMPRALWWFRWGAMITFLAGLVLFVMNYFWIPGVGLGASSLLVADGQMTSRSMWISFGMLLGTIMWFNVWFVIWPTQKSILSGKVPADQLPAARKKALLTSRINTFLSGPMLFGMLAPAHYGAITWVTLAAVTAVAVVFIWGAIVSSSKVGTSV
jgi:uncharacterized membrane protein